MPNYIIASISTMLNEGKVYEYSSDTGIVTGKQTNEAPLKALIREIALSSSEPTTIIAVVTKEAQNEFDNLKKEIRSFAQEEGIAAPGFEPVPVNADHFVSSIQRIIDFIPENGAVYVDTTGGFRNSAYLLMVVVRMLEYSGIEVKKAVYSNYNKKKVIDVTETYRLFDLINAANSFTAFGNATELESYFADTKVPEIKAVIGAMKSFSEAVALCRTSKLDRILDELNNSLLELEAIPSSQKSDTPDNESTILFRSLSSVIRRKFGLIGEQRAIEYPDVIRWCLDNQMIQQAVTIYTEKIPAYLLRHLYSVSRSVLDRADKNHAAYDVSYHILYKDFMQMQSPLIYFLKNTDENTRNVLAKCDNNSDLLHQIPAFNTTLHKHIRKALESVFELKRLLFDKSGNRCLTESEFPTKYKQLDYIRSKTAKDFFGKLRSLEQERDYYVFEKEVMPDCVVYDTPQLNTIENIAVLAETQTDFVLHCSPLEMQTILRDLLYIKSFLRNAMNHAGEQTTVKNEHEIMSYFREHGYWVDTEMPLDKIVSVIQSAVDHLNVNTGSNFDP